MTRTAINPTSPAETPFECVRTRSAAERWGQRPVKDLLALRAPGRDSHHLGASGLAVNHFVPFLSVPEVLPAVD